MVDHCERARRRERLAGARQNSTSNTKGDRNRKTSSAERRSATVQAHTSPPQFTAAFHSNRTGTRSPARSRGCRYSLRPERRPTRPVGLQGTRSRHCSLIKMRVGTDQAAKTRCEIRQRTARSPGANWDGRVMRDFTWPERSPRLVGGGGGDLLGRAGEARIRVLTGSQAAQRNLTSAPSRRRLTACQVPDTPEGPGRGDHRHPLPHHPQPQSRREPEHPRAVAGISEEGARRRRSTPHHQPHVRSRYNPDPRRRTRRGRRRRTTRLEDQRDVEPKTTDNRKARPQATDHSRDEGLGAWKVPSTNNDFDLTPSRGLRWALVEER